jgi:hypothetical protein
MVQGEAFTKSLVSQFIIDVKLQDDKEIKANDAHFKLEKSSDGPQLTARLTIKEAVTGDAGKFRCEASVIEKTAQLNCN